MPKSVAKNLNLAKNEYFIPLLIFTVSLLLRVYRIDLLPLAISHVELDYVINAKSVWLTGKDLSQNWSALSLSSLDSRETLAELPQVLWAPLIGPWPLSLFNARLPIAVFYALFPVVLYLFARQILGGKVAALAGFLFAINPWLLLLGRSNYEHPMAALFYLIGAYLFIKHNNWKILFSLPFFMLGFYSYHGAKMSLIPLVLVLAAYHYFKHQKKHLVKYYLAVTSVCIGLMAVFVLSMPHQAAGGRSRQIIFLNQDYLADKVNQERLMAIPNPFMPLFSNKLTILAKELTNTYINAFSVQNLFLTGEQTVGGLTLGKHGYFYYLDFPLLIIGMIALFVKKRKVFYLLLGMILVAPANSVINIDGQSYVCRANLLFPTMMIIIAFGLYTLFSWLGKYRIIKIGLIAVYTALFLNLLYLYFFRNPIYNSEGYFFSKRVLSEYLKRSVPFGKNIYVYADEHMAAYEQYLFYADKVNKNNTNSIAHAMSQRVFEMDKIIFESSCPSAEILANPDNLVIMESLKDCEASKELIKSNDKLKIVNLVDSGAIFYIFNDSLCKDTKLSNYVRVPNIQAFDLGKQDNQKFCSQWIVN